MCRIEGAETPDFERIEIRTARKQHKCDECSRIINVGEQYTYDFTVHGRDVDEYHTCQHCAVARKWLSNNCGGWIYSEVCEEIQEHAEEYPSIAMPLYRVAVGMRREWRRFTSEDLMPIPRYPADIEL